MFTGESCEPQEPPRAGRPSPRTPRQRDESSRLSPLRRDAQLPASPRRGAGAGARAAGHHSNLPPVRRRFSLASDRNLFAASGAASGRPLSEAQRRAASEIRASRSRLIPKRRRGACSFVRRRDTSRPPTEPPATLPENRGRDGDEDDVAHGITLRIGPGPGRRRAGLLLGDRRFSTSRSVRRRHVQNWIERGAERCEGLRRAVVRPFGSCNSRCGGRTSCHKESVCGA